MRSCKKLLCVWTVVLMNSLAFGQAANKWVKQFNTSPGYNFTAKAVVTDVSGNVIITGEKWIDPFDFDLVTVKYDSVGNELWSHVYSGANNSYESPSRVMIDNSGNIYVGGYTYASASASWLLIKLSPAGSLLWSDTTTYPPAGSGGNVLNDMEFDNAGNIILAGSLQRDLSFPTTHAAMAVVKLDATGNELWRNVTPVDYADNKISKIVVDAAGNIYAAGYEFHGSPPGQRLVVRKYGPAGSILWQDVYDADSTHNEMEAAVDIAMDASGNVYVAGTASKNGDTHRDFLLRKYDAAGTPIWTNTYSSATNAGGDQAHSMYLTPGGTAYLTGTTRVNGPDPDHIMTLKVDNAGTQQWARIYEYTSSLDATVAGIAGMANPENVAVTGTSRRDGYYVDIVTIRYNAQGDTVWTKRQPSGSQALAQGVHMGSNGDVYVTGGEAGMFQTIRIQNPDATVTKDVNGAGVNDFNSTGNTTGMSIDFGAGTGVSRMFVSLLYNTVANSSWCPATTSPAHISRYRWVAHALALQFTGAVLSLDMNLLNSVLPGGHGISDFTKYSIYQRAMDGIGDFCKLQTAYANGKLTANITSLSEFFIGSETDSFNYTLSVNDLPPVSGLGVYPNPADLSATISFDLPQEAFLTASLYDLTGRKVMAVYEGKMTVGEKRLVLNTQGLVSGIYFCRLTAAGRTSTVKVSVGH